MIINVFFYLLNILTKLMLFNEIQRPNDYIYSFLSFGINHVLN